MATRAEFRATGHEARWPAVVPPEVRACLDRVLATARFNCPLTGAAVVDAHVMTRVER